MHTWLALMTATMTLLGPGNDVETTILALEKQWSVANVHKDVAALERIMADDYIGIEAVGVVQTKAQETVTSRRATWWSRPRSRPR